jgi:hypothetical protein
MAAFVRPLWASIRAYRACQRNPHSLPSVTVTRRSNAISRKNSQNSRLMAYKVSAIMRSDKGYSFDLTSADNVPLVHFLYLREGDAIAAAKQVRVAVANAKLVKPHFGGG